MGLYGPITLKTVRLAVLKIQPIVILSKNKKGAGGAGAFFQIGMSDAYLVSASAAVARALANSKTRLRTEESVMR